MKNYIKVNEVEQLHTPRMTIVEVTYISSDGDKITHTIVRSKPSVAVIVLNKDNQIALIKQFRTTTGQWYYELPAGLIEEGENIFDAAKREVSEETGLVITDLRKVSFGPNLLDPSKSDEDFGVVVAHLNGEVQKKFDEQERISDVEWMSLTQAYHHLQGQMRYGLPFKDGLFMSGHSRDALIAYNFTENYILR